MTKGGPHNAINLMLEVEEGSRMLDDDGGEDQEDEDEDDEMQSAISEADVENDGEPQQESTDLA
jgi:hypothetical protein